MKEFENYKPEIPQPFSTVVEYGDSSVVKTTDCYLGHYPLADLKEHYGHDVHIEYFRGEYGELEGKPMVRVSWMAVEPHTIVDITK